MKVFVKEMIYDNVYFFIFCRKKINQICNHLFPGFIKSCGLFVVRARGGKKEREGNRDREREKGRGGWNRKE